MKRPSNAYEYDDHDVVDMLTELIESAVAETPVGAGPSIRVKPLRTKTYLSEDARLQLKIGSQVFVMTVFESVH